MPIPLALGLIMAAMGAAGTYSASQAYNDKQRALARETNDLTAAENQKNRDFQQSLVNQQMEYMSPKNQMEMYKQAGLSPYAYLNSGGSSVGLGSAPSSGGFQVPQQVQTFTYDAPAQLMSMVNMLTESDSKSIQNDFLAAILQKTLERMSTENESAAVNLEVEKATKDARIAYTQQQAEREKFETYLRKTYGEDMTEWQLNNLISAVNLLEQQGYTEGTKRALNDAMTKANLAGIDQRNLELSIQKYVAQSQNVVNMATSRLLDLQGEQQRILNEIGRKYGVSDKLLDLANKWQNVGNTYQRSKLMQEMIKTTKIKNKWMNKQELADFANKVTSCLNTITNIITSLSSLASGGAAAGSAGGLSYPTTSSYTLPVMMPLVP